MFCTVYFNHFTYTSICELLQSHTSTRWLWHCLWVSKFTCRTVKETKNLKSVLDFHISYQIHKAELCHAAELDTHRVQVVKGILEFLTGRQRHPAAQGKACSRLSSQLTAGTSSGLDWDWRGHFSRLAHKKLFCVRGADKHNSPGSHVHLTHHLNSWLLGELGFCGVCSLPPISLQNENPGANSILWAGIFILLLCILTSFVIPSSPHKNISCCKVCRELILFSFTHSMYTLCKLNDLHTQIFK